MNTNTAPTQTHQPASHLKTFEELEAEVNGMGTNRILPPDPLVRELPDPEGFPINALGSVLAPAAQRMHDVIQAPAALCGQSVLAAAALAVQAHRNVEVDGRSYPLSENFITVGESGERKSAVDREALRAHRDYEKTLRDRAETAKHEFDLEKAAYERAKSDAIKEKADISVIGAPPEGPLSPLLIAEEPTYEGLVKLLSIGQPSMGVFSDEGGRMLGGHGMGEDQQLKTAAGLCELWDGKRISRVRGGDGAMLLYGRRVSMHLMAQPLVIQKLIGNQLIQSQGLPSRCLTAWPKSTAGRRLYKEVNLSTDLDIQHFHDRMRAILNAPLPLAEGKRNELEPRPLGLSPGAKRTWVAFHDKIETQLGEGAALAPVRPFAAKVPEHALRMAGILTLLEAIDASEINEAALEAGINLTQFYLSESLRIHLSSAMDPDLILAQRLVDWACRRKDKLVYLSLIYQFGPAEIRTKKTALRVITILEGHRWFVRVPDGTMVDGARRKDVWRVADGAL